MSKNKKKNLLVNIIILFISSLIAFLGAELCYRVILFSDFKSFNHLKNPNHFALQDEDEYWKLYYRWDPKWPPPKNPHPLLGWIGKFNRETLFHNESKNVGTRRPVLLYGDSFASCAAKECFENYLNNDKNFSKDYYLLNYGVGGYGVDQIAILYENTIDKYENPFVVFSLFNRDLDRSILSVRTGQKPFYKIKDENLVLSGVPISPDPQKFYEENPIRIKSFLYRQFLYKINFLPKQLTSFLKKEKTRQEKKKQINSLILKKVVDDLRKKNIDFVFLIFQYIKGQKSKYNIDHIDWRDILIKDFLHKNQVPYIWHKDVVRNDKTFLEYDTWKYVIKGDGHPTSHANKIISNEIKKAVINSSN